MRDVTKLRMNALRAETERANQAFDATAAELKMLLENGNLTDAEKREIRAKLTAIESNVRHDSKCCAAKEEERKKAKEA